MMIDANDKQTQPLALDDQAAKAKRGRPATGKALSNADRQRAYRERQKAQRNGKEPEVGLRGALENWETACRNLGAANGRIQELETKIRLLEAQLAKRNENSEIGTGEWVFQYRIKGDRKWNTTGSIKPIADVEVMRNIIEGMITENQKGLHGQRWRAIRNDGMIYDPKDPG